MFCIAGLYFLEVLSVAYGNYVVKIEGEVGSILDSFYLLNEVDLLISAFPGIYKNNKIGVINFWFNIFCWVSVIEVSTKDWNPISWPEILWLISYNFTSANSWYAAVTSFSSFQQDSLYHHLQQRLRLCILCTDTSDTNLQDLFTKSIVPVSKSNNSFKPRWCHKHLLEDTGQHQDTSKGIVNYQTKTSSFLSGDNNILWIFILSLLCIHKSPMKDCHNM